MKGHEPRHPLGCAGCDQAEWAEWYDYLHKRQQAASSLSGTLASALIGVTRSVEALEYAASLDHGAEADLGGEEASDGRRHLETAAAEIRAAMRVAHIHERDIMDELTEAEKAHPKAGEPQ